MFLFVCLFVCAGLTHVWTKLREVKCGNGNTVAMIYDRFPIIDYFRYVSDDVVAGAMDSKAGSSHGTYYFYLTRVKQRLSML